MKQCTLKDSFQINGKGLHTGLQIEATFSPAPENTGYVFKRVDLEGEPTILAVAENVVETVRGTVIGNNTMRISTIEHALAALYAAGIDNCLITLNAPELPILDGSAIYYAEKIDEVGIVEQESEKDYYIVKQKIEVIDEKTGSSLIVLPDEDFSIDTMIEFDSAILQNQFASLHSMKNFKSEIAASRTFVFVREIEALLNANLIKGGDLDNAIVIYDQPMSKEALDKISNLIGIEGVEVSDLGYLNNKPLVFNNEPARHKLLDVIGDIALIGRPLKGRIIANKPGHSLNTMFSKKIRREIKRQDVQAPIYNPNLETVMDANRIRECLPYRYPFLLVDKIIEMG